MNLSRYLKATIFRMRNYSNVIALPFEMMLEVPLCTNHGSITTTHL